MNTIDNYYINLYKSKFRTSDEKKLEEDNASLFAEYCVNNPTELKPFFNWYFHVYFEGLHENSASTMFEVDLEKVAKDGQLKHILFDDRRELVMLNDCTGMFGFMFNKEYGLDKATKKSVASIMERIKVSSDFFAFKQIDWDYFFTEHWYDTLYEVYLRYISDRYLLLTCFIADSLRSNLEHYGFELEYIEDDGTKFHRSGLGINFEKVFANRQPQILTLKLEDLNL